MTTTFHAYSTATGAWLGSGPTAQAAIDDARAANALPDSAFVEVLALDGARATDPPLLLIDARPLGRFAYCGDGIDHPGSYCHVAVPAHARAVPLREADPLARLREAAAEAGSLRTWGAAHGFAQPYLSRVLAGRVPPSPRLLAALGLRPAVLEA